MSIDAVTHHLARKVLDVLAELAADGGLDPGGPLHDVYRLENGCEARLDSAVAAWVAAGCPRRRRRTTARRREVLQAIAATPGVAASDLAARLDVGERQVRNLLADLVSDRLVRATADRTDRGRYFNLTLTRRGVAALTPESRP